MENENKKYIITIDGPDCSGKTTLWKKVVLDGKLKEVQIRGIVSNIAYALKYNRDVDELINFTDNSCSVNPSTLEISFTLSGIVIPTYISFVFVNVWLCVVSLPNALVILSGILALINPSKEILAICVFHE